MNRRSGDCYSSAVIPTAWTPATRPSDTEHLDYLVPDGADGCVVPTSLVGVPLGPAQASTDAVAHLVAHGLRSLDRRWWCRLPHTLPDGVLSATEPSPDWSWQLLHHRDPGHPALTRASARTSRPPW